MSARLLIGDVFDRLRELPDGSVDLVVTSPPFLALRSYLPDDHPDKGKEIGSEATPADFLDTLLALTTELRRVLALHGSIAIELGDTYAGSGSPGGDYDEGGMRDGQPRTTYAGKRATRTNNLYNTSKRYSDDWNKGNTAGKSMEGVPDTGGAGWPLDKSLCMVPELFASSLAYGRNLLNPAHVVEPWRVRNWITWARPNPPVGALADKWRPASSFITVACVGRSRYFDLDAVRVPAKDFGPRFSEHVVRDTPGRSGQIANPLGDNGERIQSNPAGAPPLDWHSDLDGGIGLLVLATQPYAGAHYATFPSRLPQKLIECMCPSRVCRVCGKPSERITEPITPPLGNGYTKSRSEPRGRTSTATAEQKAGGNITLGWTDCGHDDWRPGLVLDPFAGSGTTLAVATGMGRDAIGIDIDARNVDLVTERVGWMFLEVDHGPQVPLDT